MMRAFLLGCLFCIPVLAEVSVRLTPGGSVDANGVYVYCELDSAASTTPLFLRESPYPPHWWEPVSKDGAPDWEIFPQDAKPGEVVLSKRNELGLLSNFAPTPFEFRGKQYASVEGLWQSMLYPEDEKDPRATFPGISWPHTREQVAAMTGFEANTAGDVAFQNMKKMNIDWVSFEGKRFKYWTPKKGEQYRIIFKAMISKVKQNSKVKDVLVATKGLTLRPDHHQPPDAPPSWRYFDIWMEIRDRQLYE